MLSDCGAAHFAVLTVALLQNDTLVLQSRLTSLYNTISAATERGYIGITGAGHNYIGQPSTIIARTMMSWMKIFIDNDDRYSQFLCPATSMSESRSTAAAAL
jgi:hypothetical protein